MHRRTYGTGSLFTARGKWYGQWRIAGRQVKRVIGPKRQPGSRDGLTRKQAEAELRRRIEATETRTPVQAPTVSEAGERLVRSLEAQGRKASTLAAYESTLRAHLVPHFGERALHRITTDDVEGFIATCRAKGCAPKSIRNYLGSLHSIFEFARVRPNPVADARKPEATDTDPDIRFPHRGGAGGALASGSRRSPRSHRAALYLTAALTGLRQGELFGLRWRDVDWGAMRVRVRRSYARKRAGREAQFGRPKSKRSSRSVPMHDRVGQELERHFQRSAYQGDDDLVFCHPAHRWSARSLQGAEALQGGTRRRRGSAGAFPRSTTHLRHPDGGGRGADADPAGVARPPRHQDDDDLRRLPGLRAGARAGGAGVRGHQFGHQSERKLSATQSN